MKKIFYLLMVTTLFITFSYSQERDSLIQLYPGMGDTLDYIDREMFNLYPDIKGFNFAQLFLRDNQYFVSKINYTYLNRKLEKVLVEDISRFTNLRTEISRLIGENQEKYGSPLNASFFINNGNNYDGKLEMFNKKYLYFNSDYDYSTGSSTPFKFKSSISNVDSLKIQALKPDLAPYLKYGSVVGVGLGLVAGLIWTNADNFKEGYEIYGVGITTLVGWGAGALLGLFIGAVTPSEFLTIRFNSTNDVTKLKDYSVYYFQHDKSLEEKYVELE